MAPQAQDRLVAGREIRWVVWSSGHRHSRAGHVVGGSFVVSFALAGFVDAPRGRPVAA
jgi:hypothetical protein